jgi:hypothetical protein
MPGDADGVRYGGTMGDLSSEPSMEEILSSIKRIIAEEGEATPGRGRRAGRAAPPVAAEDEVLELSDPMPQERPADAIRSGSARSDAARAEPVAAEPSVPEPVRAEAPRASDRARPADEPAPAQPPVAAKREAERPADAATRTPAPLRARVDAAAAEPIVSSGTVEATRGALDQLSRMLVRPEPGVDGTLEGLVREMLRPMLRDWLDANLPALVEDLVAREIDKIMASRR